jgi:hypothetical protein
MVAAPGAWVTGGMLHPTVADVEPVRVLLLTGLPAVAGLLLGIGVAMRRG